MTSSEMTASESSTAESPQPTRGSLRVQFSLFFLAAVVAAVAGITIAALAFNRLLDARADLVDKVDSAAVDSQRLLAALAEQESGVRGYVLSGELAFLEPYTTGAVDESAVVESLMHELDGLPAAQAAFARARTDADRWRNDYAEPTIAAIRVGDVAPRSEDALAHGKELFDVIRSSFDALDARLTHDRAAAKDRLDTATYELSTVLAIFGLLVLLGGAGVWWIFRVRVREPLAALSSDARRVAGGELDHQVRQTGPIEFAMLAADVESMRGRIVDELVIVSEARQSLEAQAHVLARSNAELEQFAYVASHDLQEPLRKVASFCQLLQSRYGGQLDDKADQYIEFAVDGAKRMQALINDLLAFSRAGRVRGPMVEVDCSRAVDDAVDNLAERIAEVDARIIKGHLPRVKGERALLTAVFQNLIGNAIKFTRAGVAPVIDVGAERHIDGDEAMWLFTIRDNGIGIATQHAERVFTIFQRLHAKDAYEGTGIGLALCRKIVEDLGGRIWIVESEQDDQPAQHEESAEPGTTICFTLPVAEPVEDPPGPSPTGSRPDPALPVPDPTSPSTEVTA